MRFIYLLINLFSILGPLFFSFYPRRVFYKEWSSLFPAIVLSAILFIGWDIYFTHLGVWQFNPKYLTGFYIANLPVEEILFFVCIPYACVFTWFNIEPNLKTLSSKKAGDIITIILIITFIVVAGVNYQRIYTFSSFAVLACLLLLAWYILQVKWLLNFYIVYAILLVPFIIVNGLLTGTLLKEPVVLYNNSQILGVRILTIPVEDIFYGMSLVLLNVMLYEYFRSRDKGSSYISE